MTTQNSRIEISFSQPVDIVGTLIARGLYFGTLVVASG